LEVDTTRSPTAVRVKSHALLLAPSYTFTLSQQVSALAYVRVKVITLPAGATKVEALHTQLLP
jgi:hypothetical protein